MSMTHKEMIEVIAAHKDGRIIQYRRRIVGEHWQDTEPPCWSFNAYDYRAKPLVSPAKVKMWQWLYKHTDGSISATTGFYRNIQDVSESLPYKVIGPAKWTEIEVDAHCAERK